MLELAKSYSKMLEEERQMTKEQAAIANVGKVDAKKRLEQDVTELMSKNIDQCLSSMLDSVVFQQA